MTAIQMADPAEYRNRTNIINLLIVLLGAFAVNASKDAVIAIHAGTWSDEVWGPRAVFRSDDIVPHMAL